MKILIVTMHRVSNYGSVLQAYALQNYLQELGHEVTILDYYPERQTPLGALKRIKNKISLPKIFIIVCQIVMIPSYIKRLLVFNSYRANTLNMTKKYAKSTIVLEEEYDLYLTGSDQVWNYKESEGIDATYYFGFLNTKNKMSYAASFGLDFIEEEYKDRIANYLNEYAWISVRETTGIEILQSLGFYNINRVVDPVLLYDIDFWNGKVSNKQKKHNYLLVYNLHRSRDLDDWCFDFAKENKLDLIYIGYSYHEKIKRGKYICVPTVPDFLSFIKNASCIISDSFHATVFSVIYNKPFYSMVPKLYGSRIKDFLLDLKLEGQIVDQIKRNDIPYIDYSKINIILEKERKESREIIMKNVGENINL